MARYGSPANPGGPDDEPTRFGYPALQSPPTGPPASPDFAGPAATPWFRRRPVLIAWILLIAVTIALVIWGIIQLTSRGPGSGTGPGTTSSSTPTSSPSAGVTTTTAPSIRSTGPTTAAPPSAAPPRQAPPSQAPQPAGPAEEPPHHHRPHLPPLPSVVTIPPIPKAPEVPTVITLPPGL